MLDEDLYPVAKWVMWMLIKNICLSISEHLDKVFEYMLLEKYFISPWMIAI